MKNLIWDYKAKRLLDCQDLKLDINLNPTSSFGIHIHKSGSDLCQIEFSLDWSYYNWIREWLDSCSSQMLMAIEYKRDLHLNIDVVFKGCIPKLINLDNDNNKIEIIIQCDTYHPLPFSQILEVHRDIMISDILD